MVNNTYRDIEEFDREDPRRYISDVSLRDCHKCAPGLNPTNESLEESVRELRTCLAYQIQLPNKFGVLRAKTVEVHVLREERHDEYEYG